MISVDLVVVLWGRGGGVRGGKGGGREWKRGRRSVDIFRNLPGLLTPNTQVNA